MAAVKRAKRHAKRPDPLGPEVWVEEEIAPGHTSKYPNERGYTRMYRSRLKPGNKAFEFRDFDDSARDYDTTRKGYNAMYFNQPMLGPSPAGVWTYRLLSLIPMETENALGEVCP